VEGWDVFCPMLQATSDKAAKSTVTSGKGTVSMPPFSRNFFAKIGFSSYPKDTFSYPQK
jgi:hypothetical protein